MPRRIPIREQLARGWYELQPEVVEGSEIPFEEASPELLEHCYERAHETLMMLASERQVAA